MQSPKKKIRLLIIDDDEVFARSTQAFLQDDATDVFIASTGREGLNLCLQQKFDIVLLDQQLPDGEGAALCPRILSTNDRGKIIFITAYPSFSNALKAIENGAFSYLSKPIEPQEIKITVAKCLRIMDLEKDAEGFRYRENKDNEAIVLAGSSPGLLQVAALVELAASSDANVLITGETGTGKSLVARLIHRQGQKRGAFVSINCAALPENLIEAELFGFEKGSFSGALGCKKGLFEIAEEGTILLDEIGEMGAHLQAKLLGVLDDKKIRRIGGTVSREINTRIIAATNSRIEDRLKSKEFREDLYFRLNVIRIHIPPLRERSGDIADLANHFLATMSPANPSTLSPDEITSLEVYDWPGNIRELRNVIERTVILHRQGPYQPSLLVEGQGDSGARRGDRGEAQIQTLADLERQAIRRTLSSLSGNYTQTAKALGISLSTLKRKIKEYRKQ